MRLTAIVWMLLFAGLARGQSEEQIREYDARLRAELEARAPQALSAWDEANAARKANDVDTAAVGYRKVTEIAPTFSHAQRRLCSVLYETDRPAALTACRKARELADLDENAATLALVLSSDGTPGERQEAARLIDERLHRSEDPATVGVFCYAAANLDDGRRYGACSQRLLALDPDGLQANAMATMAAAGRGDLDVARRHLERARSAGLPDDAYRSILAQLEENEPRTGRYLRWGGVILAAWFGAFALLLFAAWILNRLALRSAARPPRDVRENASPGEHRLRQVYGAILFLCVAFFYLSVPVLLVTVLGAFGGAIYFFFAIGHVPIKLVLILVVVGGATMWAILRSLFFARGRDEDPGTRLPLEAHPRLRAVLDEVAERIETRPVDNVYLTPGTDMAVTERRRERCLILGVAVLDGMGLLELKSILGHEYGHFRNADTAGGQTALAVRLSLLQLATRLAEGGAAAWYNPAWWFVRGFWAMFLRISHGASRLQEVLADRWAAAAYGSAAFASGLRHVVARSVAFEWHANQTVSQAAQTSVPVPNFYRFQPEGVSDAQPQLQADITEAMGREPSAYDSHPPPELRIRWVEALAVPPPASEPDGLAWDLFEDPEALQRQMTDEIRHNVQWAHGIELRAQ